MGGRLLGRVGGLLGSDKGGFGIVRYLFGGPWSSFLGVGALFLSAGDSFRRAGILYLGAGISVSRTGDSLSAAENSGDLGSGFGEGLTSYRALGEMSGGREWRK